MYIKIKVVPGAKTEKFEQEDEDTFAVSVREPAERNRANRRVLELVARHFARPLGKVKIVTGHHSRSKIVVIDN